MMRFLWRGTNFPAAAPIQSAARSVRRISTSSTVISTSAPHPRSAVFASVDGTANPNSTMIGPMIASAPTDATCNSENVRIPDVARRGSTPRSCSERTCAAVPAAPPNGAAVATALPTSCVDATSGSERCTPLSSWISMRCSTHVR